MARPIRAESGRTREAPGGAEVTCGYGRWGCRTRLDYLFGTEIWVPFANLSASEVMPLGRLSSHATAREAAEELGGSFEREPKSECRM